MGQSYKVAWDEIWHLVEPSFTEAFNSGLSTMKDDDLLFMNRNGFIEETYFTWSLIPIVGENGKISGMYNPCFEVRICPRASESPS
jgi:hypothetical protein